MYNPAPIHAPIGRAASPNTMGGIQRSRSPAPTGGILRNRSPVPPEPQGYYGGPNQGYGGPPGGAYGNPGMARPLSRGPVSPNMPPANILGPTSPEISGFQVEKRSRSPNPYGRPMQQPEPVQYRDEAAIFRDQVAALIDAKEAQFAVNGRIPVDPAQLILFFRSKTGVAHALDFPIDVSYNTPPALDVLIAACRPHVSSSSYGGQQPLFFPPNLPLTASLEISNYPILDAVRNTIFPNLPPGQYLTTLLDRLDVVEEGVRLPIQSPAGLTNDERAATIVVTLPVRFRGGTIVIRDQEGREERFQGGGGKTGDIDWVALRADCTYEIEQVQKGVFVSIRYGVYVKSFGPNTLGSPGSQGADTLVTPTDTFFDLLSPILNQSRGKSVAFYLSQEYVGNPADEVANAIVPQLKGGDALLYDAFKFHKLVPELHWTAGGYIWPVDQTLEYFVDDVARTTAARGISSPSTPYARNLPGRGGPTGGYGGNPTTGAYGGDEGNGLVPRVQASGAVSLADAGVMLMTDYNNPSPSIGKMRVNFVSSGELTKLVVNVLLVVYIP
ncbi:hypothetical protein CPB83DRAFT_849558 [Crepidotus variabilis]|uniref:Uncharacterized protein n=1 Tax=Crepidotus variabilis TaxID=179855 RepID=A0A9P6ELX0_9AGAR|nr:hypothetical protein CPB83DRAFT_849558 [Crepidotus variabilis]